MPGGVFLGLAEWVLLAAAIAIIAYLIVSLRAIIKAGRGNRLTAFWRRAIPAVATVAAIWVIFMALQGLNYYRPTFAQLAGYGPALEQARSLPAEKHAARLAELCQELGRRMDASRAALGPVSDQWLRSRPATSGDGRGDFPAMAQEAKSLVEALNSPYPGLFDVEFSTPKPVLASRLLSLMGITGFYFPFTAEANASVDWPRFCVPATLCHELAHRAGFMREDEANYLGYLACVNSEDPLARYSGYTLAYDHAMNTLYGQDQAAWARINRQRSAAVAGDRAARSSMAASYRGPLQDLGDAVNDGYLKAQGQSSGTASYGLMVDLLLADPEFS